MYFEPNDFFLILKFCGVTCSFQDEKELMVIKLKWMNLCGLNLINDDNVIRYINKLFLKNVRLVGLIIIIHRLVRTIGKNY